MRRDGRTSYEQEQNQGSSWLSGLGWMISGLGVGAGLLYFLDPDKGAKRRRQIYRQAQGWGQSLAETAKSGASSASEYASSAYDSARSLLGGLGSSGSAKLSDIQDWSQDQLESLGDRIHEMLGGQTRGQRVVGVSVCALSSMALGAALMYIFDPQMGRQRRQVAMEKISDYSSKAGQTVSQYSQKAGEAIRSGAQQVKESVQNVASQVGIGSSQQAEQGNCCD